MEATNAKQEDEFAAFVGIDWADRKHTWAMQSGTAMERGTVDHTPEAVEAWAMELGRRFDGRPIAIALEQSRGALLFMLTKYAHLVLFPVHPATLASYRKSFRPSGAKSDPSDADLILELLLHHRANLRRLNPDTLETRTLQFLVEHRRQFVDEQTRYSNRLIAYIKMYFPQILDWFKEINSDVVGDFLEKWPTLEKLQKARQETIRQFLVQHHCRSNNLDGRLEAIRKTVPATLDMAVVSTCSTAAVALVRMLRQLRETIRAYDQQIETVARAHPDFALFDSLPGAGQVMVPRLIAALGTQRERFATANELQSYSGIAPVLVSSGKTAWVRWRWACPKFLRQTFHEWARCSIRYCDWAKAYYDQQRGRGKSAQVAFRSLAFKWMRIVFRLWKDHKPYEEEVYRKALTRRQQSTANSKSITVQLQWKNVGGFSKIAGISLD
jgi:transposase